jgi:preprotein translocase subunit SecE
MNKLKQKVEGAKTFFGEVVNEIKKATWPEKQELIESTLVVIVSVVMLSGFVAVCDFGLLSLRKLLIP